MNNQYTVNCYCFNKKCRNSIFNITTYAVVKVPFSRILSEKVVCEACGEELVSKQLLSMKMGIDDLVKAHPVSA